MIIIDIIKSAGKAYGDRRKRIKTLLDKFEHLQERVEGIYSFAETLQEMKTQIAVLTESIGMIKSFFNIQDRRQKQVKIKKNRRNA